MRWLHRGVISAYKDGITNARQMNKINLDIDGQLETTGILKRRQLSCTFPNQSSSKKIGISTAHLVVPLRTRKKTDTVVARLNNRHCFLFWPNLI